MNTRAKVLPTGPFDALALKAGYKGTDLTITAASTIYAVHGPDGIDEPQMGDLDWLRMLLQSCRTPGAFEAIVGSSDDPAAISDMLTGVEAMYRRLAQLTGYRQDIHPDERPAPYMPEHAAVWPDEIPF